MDVKLFAKMVALEMTEMENLGIKIPARAFEITNDMDEMDGYTNMKVCDCADLLISLGQIGAI